MAGAGRKVWTGETLSVPDLQNYLQDQTVMAFSNAADRSAQIPAPTDGMVTFLASPGRLEVRIAGVWVPVRVGRTDADYTTMTVTAPWTVIPEGARAIVLGGICYFQVGALRNAATSGSTVFTFPTGMRPLHNFWFVGDWAGTPVEARVAPDGRLIATWGGAVPGGVVASGSFPVVA
jgi:hypothetical protein